MIKSRIHHWSCSKFADWIRGEKKPVALGWDEWGQWHEEAKKKRPVRHFFAEEVLGRIQDLVMFPKDLWRTVRAYVDNRFVHKTHCLKTGLEPGRFHELDERILHGLFNELKEFVELDLGMTYAAWHKGEFKPRRGICPEAGIAHLQWSMSLKLDEDYGVSKKDKKYGLPTPQAESSKEILELYSWWESRDSRPDPAEISGWRNAVDEDAPETTRRKAYRKMSALENKYEKEDDRMLQRLIKMRRHLWT